MPIVWTRPDGSLIIERFAENFLAQHRQEGESTTDLVMRLTPLLQAKSGRDEIRSLTPTLVREADLPATRDKRHAWRLHNGKVVVDATIPDLPHPKQALRDKVAQAKTIDDMRAILAEVIG